MADLEFPSEFAHLIEFELRPDQFANFKEAATRIAAAYNRSVGIQWAAYSTYAGPSSTVYVLMPLRCLDQLDETPPVDEVLVGEYGEAANVFLRDYQQAVSRVGSSILTRLPVLAGREGKWDPQMPAYLYHTKFVTRAGDGDRFQAAAERVADAHRRHGEGLTWFAYGTLAGEPVVHRLVPLHRLGELRQVQQIARVVQDVHGPETGAAILHDLQGSLAESRSSVLQYLGHYAG
jgi:hypothetical protein